MIGALLQLRGSLDFFNNVAIDGGALQLVSFAQLRLHSLLTMTFNSNIGR